MKKIRVSEDFSDSPGGRTVGEGPNSGERFRKEFLDEFFLSGAVETVEIDLDGTFGYPTSFLDEAFGELARKHTPQLVLSKISFVSKEQPSLIDKIKNDYIIDCYGTK